MEVNKYIYGWLNYIRTRAVYMNMSENSIVGLTVTQCVHSLQVVICLPVYAYFRGQIQCEEMTVAVSAVVGSMITRITRQNISNTSFYIYQGKLYTKSIWKF